MRHFPLHHEPNLHSTTGFLLGTLSAVAAIHCVSATFRSTCSEGVEEIKASCRGDLGVDANYSYHHPELKKNGLSVDKSTIPTSNMYDCCLLFPGSASPDPRRGRDALAASSLKTNLAWASYVGEIRRLTQKEMQLPPPSGMLITQP